MGITQVATVYSKGSELGLLDGLQGVHELGPKKLCVCVYVCIFMFLKRGGLHCFHQVLKRFHGPTSLRTIGL